MLDHLKKYWVYWAVALLLLLIAIKVMKDRNPPNPNGNNTVSFTSSIDENIILSKGSQGSEVKELQKILNDIGEESSALDGSSWYFVPLSEDGVFGDLTLSALIDIADVTNITLAEAKNL